MQRPDPAQVSRQEFEQSEQERGQLNMVFGGLWLAGGMLVTLINFLGPKVGGTYVAWGTMILGALQFLVGWLQKRSV